MKHRILVVDDDEAILKFIEFLLIKDGYDFTGFDSPEKALRSFYNNDYSAVISDYYMPGMNGDEFLKEIRIKDKFTPFIVLTSSRDLKVVVDLMQKGADEYISKPLVNEDFIFRIEKVIKENANRRLIDKIEKEKEIAVLESKRLADWKYLYATKDTKQSEVLIELFNRTLNEGGGFAWVDLLKKEMVKSEGDKYTISSELAELIIKTSERHKAFFNNIAYIASLNSINLNVKEISYKDFLESVNNYLESDFEWIHNKYERELIIQKSNQIIDGDMIICLDYINKILKELIINAIKYSPEKTPVYVMFEKKSDVSKGDFIEIVVKNTPREMHTRKSDFSRHFSNNNETSSGGFIESHDDVVLFGDDDGVMLFDDTEIKADEQDLKLDVVTGVPYEYSELVFDLFYTIEPFPVELDEEDWRGGTGLYISRKIINRHNGWIRNANGIDYSHGEPIPFVSFIVSLPLKHS